MELSSLIEAITALAAPDYIAERTSRGLVCLEIPEAEYDAAVAAIDHLKLADLINNKRAMAAFPKLVNAVKLVLVIERTDVGTGSRVVLDKKAKAQLISALKAAGEEIPG